MNKRNRKTESVIVTNAPIEDPAIINGSSSTGWGKQTIITKQKEVTS